MSFWELLILAVGLSMDAFAASVCKGLSLKKQAGLKAQLVCGLWFGTFQALMPFSGYFLGSLFVEAIGAVDHWIAFFLLSVVGLNLIKEAFHEETPQNGGLSPVPMLVLALATSIDALAVGISLAMTGVQNIGRISLFIGLVTALISALGVALGSFFGAKLRKEAQIFGGCLLIFLGVKILLGDLGIL